MFPISLPSLVLARVTVLLRAISIQGVVAIFALKMQVSLKFKKNLIYPLIPFPKLFISLHESKFQSYVPFFLPELMSYRVSLTMNFLIFCLRRSSFFFKCFAGY